MTPLPVIVLLSAIGPLEMVPRHVAPAWYENGPNVGAVWNRVPGAMYEGDAPRSPCDWNRDCTLDSRDFLAFLTDWFQGRGDFDRDGATDDADFAAFQLCMTGAPPHGR